jgi:SNF2 family DNA or RNA helicase
VRKTKLYQHQEAALKQSENLNRVAYYHDMGLGKTFTGAEKMVRLGADTNLLVCQKSKISDWIEHFTRYYPKAVVCDLTKKGAVDEFVLRFDAWHGWHGASFTVGVINYELVWRRKDLLKLRGFTLMLDESSLIQNKAAKQTKFILKLQPENVILLSGTPTSGKYENLWTQVHLLGWPISEQLYKRQYVNWKNLCVPGGQIVKVVDKENPYKNVDRLKNKMRQYGAQFLKTEEVMNLPEQNFIEVSVSSSKEYRKFMKDSIVTVDGMELVGDTSLTKRLYARQLCGVYSKAKLEAFRNLVESTNDRIIVFYNFTDEVKQLIHIANDLERPWAIISGTAKVLSAYEHFDDSITFVQYQAGAMGLNLQKANKIVYYSLPERSELFEQSKKRIHRIGQEKPCFYYLMICKNTVEENIYKALKMRRDFTDELFRECDTNGARKKL